MKGSVAFIFFMLFLAGIAFVNLRGMKDQADNAATSPESLIASAWKPDRLAGMSLGEDSRMYVQFEADGQLGGHGGCNRFFASYEINEGVLEIGPIGATRMACPEPAMSFEISLFEALESVSSASFNGQRLVLINPGGDTAIRLVAIERIETD